MRKILFRGKSVIDNKWVYGYYYKAKLCVTDKNLCDYITTSYPKINGKKSDHIMIIPETIGQYTGLCDKNGVKIFEGDIVKEKFEGQNHALDDGGFSYYEEDFYGFKIGKVVFSGTGTFIISNYGELWVNGERAEYTPTKIKRLSARRSEVIGNIFENPDLLEVEENGQQISTNC